MKNKTLRALWAAAREYGVDSDAIHELAYSEFEKKSLKELTDGEGWYLINKIKGEPTVKPKTQNRPGMATEKQKWLIDKLAEELGWGDNPARLRGFLHKYVHCDFAEWMTTRQASRAIEGLKALLEKRKAEKQ